MKYLTTAQAAAFLKVKVRRVQTLIENGRIKGVAYFGRAFMIPDTSLAAVKDRPPGRPRSKPKPRRRKG